MARQFTYADALVLLGGSSPAVAAFDRVLGGVLTVGRVAGVGVAGTLADVRGEFVRVGNSVMVGLRDRMLGLGRFDRTQRLRAAHAVIVVTAYFEAVDGEALPFALSEVALTRADQTSLAEADSGTSGVGSWIADVAAADVPVPSPDCSYGAVLDGLRRWYGSLSQRFISYLGGLAVWDRLDESTRARAAATLRDDLPARAVDRYDIMFRTLALEIPEFGLWAQQQGDRAMRSDLGRIRQSLLDLEALLRESVSDRQQRHRSALAAAYRAWLDDPILGGAGTPRGLRMPTLGQIYIDPHFRVRPAVPGDRPSDEEWWGQTSGRDDLSDFLAGYLTAPAATEGPLVVLGQPGAGKSALTKILAARLPATDFLPVWVPLREVPADADLQDQIEHALRAATGERTTWPELCRTADGALPVVLLDGFDELLQATGVSQSDFLEKVSAFQHREAIQQRPTAMIVTSRTAVADRARIPEGTLVVRLDPFSSEQITRWLDVWNRSNASLWTDNGLRPLPAAVAHRYGELAGQPLLLLMLALYDAQANELQTLAAALPDPSGHDVSARSLLDAAGLYERLLTSYVDREIRKSHDGVPGPARSSTVESEMTQLSIAAFAMFNRSRQWVTEAELDTDLAALSVAATNPSGVGGFRAPLTPGQELVGRFFFIQRAQAVRDNQRLQTYEFLHATFGEYLVSRLTVRLLNDLTTREAATSLPLRPVSTDDGLLYSLLSFAPLTGRGAILPFVRSALAGSAHAAGLVDLVLRTFHAATGWTDTPSSAYHPVRLPLVDRHAIYTLNLVLLTVAGADVTATELFPHAAEPIVEWCRSVGRWQAAVNDDSWSILIHSLSARRTWNDARRDLQLNLAPGDVAGAEPVDPYWTHNFAPGSSGRRLRSFRYQDQDDIRLTYHLRCIPLDEILRHTAEPLIRTMGSAVTTFAVLSEDDSQSIAHSLVSLWLDSDLGAIGETLTARYTAAVTAATKAWPPPTYQPPGTTATLTLLLRLLGRDADALPAVDVIGWCQTITECEYRQPEHLPLILHCLLTTASTGDPRRSMLITDVVAALSTSDSARLKWDATPRLTAWTTLIEQGHADLARQLFGPPEDFLASPPITYALRRDPVLALRVRVASAMLGVGDAYLPTHAEIGDSGTAHGP